jgi:TPP-dependent indolepyruvate ferredoxin oxidoreductase alpha subunit
MQQRGTSLAGTSLARARSATAAATAVVVVADDESLDGASQRRVSVELQHLRSTRALRRSRLQWVLDVGRS